MKLTKLKPNNKAKYFSEKFQSNGDNYKPEDFPLEIFPEKIQSIIIRLEKTMNYQPQTTSAGVLFAASTAIGSLNVFRVKNGWDALAGMWLCVIGSSGSTKSHPISWAIKPLKKIEGMLRNEYKAEVEIYNKKSKKEKEDQEIERPQRKHRYINNATTEGLARGNEENPSGIGYHIDELKGLFGSFNQYKGGNGNDQEFYLSAFDNGSHITLRAQADERHVDKIYVPLIGSMQPEILRGMAVNYTENGMLQRWLYVENKTELNKFTLNDVSERDTKSYSDFILDIYYKSLRNKDEEKKELIIRLNKDAEEYFIKKMNSIIKLKHSDKTSVLMRGYLSKMETYYPRFIHIIAIMNNDTHFIGEKTVFKANNLVDYFMNSAESAFISMDNKELIDLIFKEEGATTKTEKINAILKHQPEMSAKSIASFAGSTRDMVYKVKESV